MKVVYTLIFLFIFSPLTYCQTNQLKKTVVASCKRSVENKAINFCNFSGDTLSFDQINNCNHLTTSDSSVKTIDSFILSYYMADGTTVVETNGNANMLSRQTLDDILKDRPTKILFEKIIGTSNNGTLILGYRYFCMK